VLASAPSNAFLSTGVLSKRKVKRVAEMDKPLIFLSHAGEDTQPARDLALHLKQAGLQVWLDVERLTPGDRWGEKIEEGLKQAKTFVLYVGKSGVRNWVDQEVRVALDRSTKEKDFRLIPVLGPSADPDALPLFLKQYQWLDLRQADAGQPTSNAH
jgi:hypothetical protein